MSFLYPLLLAGVAAIGLPILAHMIRSKARKRVEFSSLMFVPVTLPRFSKRSRIEHLLLLILRCAVFCLLAFAFSRPFFKRPAADNHTISAKRTAVLIDTSASMRRAGLWAGALGEARSVLKDADPADRLCVMTFDQGVRTLIGFEQWGQLDPGKRSAVMDDEMSGLSPGWARTNLGGALVAAAEAIEEDEVNDDGQGGAAISRVVLISDLQQGCDVEALEAYEWPKHIELAVRRVRCRGATNAGVQLLADRSGLGGAEDDGGTRVRITNSPDAEAELFSLDWAGETSSDTSSRAAALYVPPGHSIAAPAPVRAETTEPGRLVLAGDDHDFDNVVYLAPPLQQETNILYIGSGEPNDSDQMLYYVRKAFETGGALKACVVARRGGGNIAAAEIQAAHLIVVCEGVGRENLAGLRRYIESGGTLLLVANSAGAVEAMAGIAALDNLQSEQAQVDRYAMLGRIDFKHPLMSPFSEPRFGDFTRIHFWGYRRISVSDCPGVRVLAWFDSDDPAWMEIPAGKGSLFVFACGWRPSDSDLALSSKFVPLLYSMLEYGGGLAERKLQYFVGEAVPAPVRMSPGSWDMKVRGPDGSVTALDAGQRIFTGTDLPGIYTIESGDQRRLFAVNVPARESRTAPMPVEDIERFGVSLERPGVAAAEHTERRKQHGSMVEMEGRQKLWRWVLVAALALLLTETWLAGWLTRPASTSEGGQT